MSHLTSAPVAPAPRLMVGDMVQAQWRVGNMTQGSGWVFAAHIPTSAPLYRITSVSPWGYTIALGDSGAQAGITDACLIPA